MKTILVAVLMLAATSAHAAGAVLATSPFTPAERAAAQESVKAVAQTFGIEGVSSTAQSWPAVADKALGLMTSAVSSVAGAVEKAAPQVMRIMVKQQYAKALGNLIPPVIIIVMMLVASRVVRKLWIVAPDEPVFDHTDGPFTNRAARGVVTIIVPLIVCVVVGFDLANVLGDSVKLLVNPEFYAIRDLLQMLLKPGSM